MMTVLVGLVGFLSGLYAGRKRAAGKTWEKIFVDFALDIWKALCWGYGSVSGLFRKGAANSCDNSIDDD